jgi:hypothetical protein
MLAPVEVLQLAACAGGLDAAQLRMLKAQVTTPKAPKSAPTQPCPSIPAFLSQFLILTHTHRQI